VLRPFAESAFGEAGAAPDIFAVRRRAPLRPLHSIEKVGSGSSSIANGRAKRQHKHAARA
jgi:hypothetical protein